MESTSIFRTLRLKSVIKITWLFSALFLFSLNAIGQDKALEGTITDESNIGLPGVNILIKNTSVGTITNVDGKFKITGVKSSDILVITYLGFETQELVVGERTTFNITLKEATELLSEIVVVGYGTQKKENLTGAVGVINPEEEIGNQVATNAETLLQGRVAGVQLTQSGGKPGAGAKIVIRGVGTLGNSDPLVLIDGVPGSMSDILPADIENISVLKDAASASIYGTRAANGVVLVTTKKGDGKLKITYNGYAGLQKATVLPDFLGGADYAMLKNEANENAGRTSVYSEEDIAKARSGEHPYTYANTDWADQTFKDGAFFQNHQLSLNNSIGGTKYLASVGYLDQNGIMYGTKAERLSYRLNLRSELSKFVTIGANVFGAFKNGEESSHTGDQSVMRLIANSSPLVPVFNEDGSWGSSSGVVGESDTKNPLFYGTEAGRLKTKSTRTVLNPYLEIKPLKGLTFKSNFSYSFSEGLNKSQKNKFQLTDNEGDDSDIGSVQNSLKDVSNTYTTYQLENTLNYKLKTGKNQFNFLVGNTLYKYEHRTSTINVTDLPSSFLDQVGSGTNPTVAGSYTANSLLSYFGRVQYTFDERFLLEANLRADASSKFPVDNRYAVFPAVSAGWIFSNEDWLNGIDMLSFGKVRANWGQLGNDKIGAYPYSQTYTPTDGYPFNGSDIAYGGLAITTLANPNLKWETTTSYGVGIDLGFWDDKLTLTGDYFIKDTEDILLRLPVSATSGITSEPYQNAGRVKNEGWELAINHVNRLDDIGFSYNIGFNLTHIKNEIMDLKGIPVPIGNNRIHEEGQPVGAFYGYDNIGIYREESELDQYAYIDGQTPQLGDLIYRDVNGDNKIDSEDRVIMGSPFPDFSYGINAGASFKGFDFKIFLQGVQNISIYSASTGNHSGNLNNQMNWTTDWLDRWTPENPNAVKPRLGNTNNAVVSSFWLEDASYLRVKNMEIGYSFGENITSKLKVKQLRIYANSTNPFTFTELKHWDPERYASQSRNEAYPQLTTLTFGANITL